MTQPDSPRTGRRPGAMTMAMQAVPMRRGGPRVLRIGLFKDKKIVEERIIRRRETVSIGTAARNHLIIKSGTLPAKLESRFELFQLVGDDYILNFTGDMNGKVALPGGVQKLEHLRETGAARNAGTHYQIKLADSSRGTIRMGDFTVFFEFVTAPPITPKPQLPAAVQRGFVKNIDWTFTTWVIFSYMLFFGFIIYMENADWEIETGTQEMPENLARLIFEAPVEPPEVEEEVPGDEAEEEAEEKEAKAERPDKKPDARGAQEAAGSADDPAVSAEARARIAQEAAAQAEAMLLGALGGDGGALGDVLAGGAVTGNAADVLAQASGVGVATKSETGTLRTRTGGGSGQSAGLGSLKASKGAGKAAKEGAAVKERQVRGDVGVRTGGDIGGSGEFDAALVQRQIKQRIKSITRCYESELRKNPGLAGKVTVTFTIQERGNVTGAKATENTTGSPAVANCVTRTISRFRFNPGPDGGSVTFRYPFVFQPQN
ncbi:MAG: TonB family protein [Myxococcales bacterium]|nr:TonB family protein [Myxococcales bacterium]MDH3844808.1 TonB family protein [Myxococcales bacterium]